MFIMKDKHIKAAEQGSVLLGLILTVLVLGVLGGAMVTLTTTSTYSEVFANREKAAYYLAESGGRYAIPQIMNDLDQAKTDLHGNSYTVDSGKFELSIDDSSPDEVVLESTGIIYEGSKFEARVKNTYVFPVGGLFNYPTFVKNRITLKNSSTINGDVGTNGPISNIDDSAGTINGSKEELVGKDMTPKTLPAGGTPDTLTAIKTFNAGTYRLPLVNLPNSNVATINGNVVLIVEGPMTLGNSASIEILAGSSLTIYVDGNIELKNSAELDNQTNDASKLIVYGTVNCTSVQLKNNSAIIGAIYAPAADIVVHNSVNITGSFVGNNIELKNGATVTYDTNLEDLGGGGISGGPVQYS